MDALTSTSAPGQSAKTQAARRRIESFRRQFGSAHLYLAYHAAFPLALTPDLLYCLWSNFQRDTQQRPLEIPWLAVADLLLSRLCREVSHELYEMNTEVRNLLLQELEASPLFGHPRLHEMAEFLVAYVENEAHSLDEEVRDLAEAQRWVALAWTRPDEVVQDLQTTLETGSKAEHWRILNLQDAFPESLQQRLQAVISRFQQTKQRDLEKASLTEIVLQIGDVIGSYEILTEITSTGLATIYHARQSILNRDVALKIFNTDLIRDVKTREWLLSNARAVAQLHHPNILSIYDVVWDTKRDLAYIVMDYVSSGTLKDLIGEPMPLDQVMNLVEQISAGLHYAHNHGVIHCDIKPSNIWLDKNNHILISNFDVAYIVDITKPTESGPWGTPIYMDPERAQTDSVDVRTDIYSIGVMVYEMVTGQLPFRTPFENLSRKTLPPPPHTLRPDLSLEVEAVILKALATEPTERFADVQAFSEALKAAIETKVSLPPLVVPAQVGTKSSVIIDNLIGATLDGYVILAEIASGGITTVYHARQPSLDRDVAIKILRAHLTQDVERREWFVRTAKVVARLHHPNILTIYDVKWDPEKDIAFIVMEYLSGNPFKELMGPPMPVEQIMPLLEQICVALDYVHRHGITHRDIKPSSFLLDKNNRILLSNFDIAYVSDVTGITEGEVVGTPDYIAPEQIEGAPVDARTDIYSLGIMVYEMLTGHLPFEAESPMRAMLKRMTEPPPSPRVFRPNLSREAEAVILKAMAMSPSDRFSDVQSFWQALKEALSVPSRNKRRRIPLQRDDTLANGRYKIIKPLGEGAYGIVYLAHDTRLERQVALKLLHNKVARDRRELKRFRREPMITAQIGNHPNIVGVFDFEVEDESEGISYIIMEYVDGGSLREYLQNRRNMHTLEIARFGRDICQGLEAIHEHHIIHLDLKPGNIMLKTRQRHLTAKVSDFGNAIIRQPRSKDDLEDPTPSGEPRGSLLYASPEQIFYQPGGDLDGRADLYSLGAILYEMATAHPPFDIEGTKPIVQRINEDSPTPPSTYNSFISKQLEEIILKALQKKPEDRFRNANEMIEALRQAEQEEFAKQKVLDNDKQPDSQPVLDHLSDMSPLSPNFMKEADIVEIVDNTTADSQQVQRILHLRNLLHVYYRNLTYTEERIAFSFPDPPLALLNQRDQLLEAIATTKSNLGDILKTDFILPTPMTREEAKASLWFYENEKLIDLVEVEDLNWAEPVYLGRSRGCQIVVRQEYTQVSRQHAQLFREGDNYLLKDNKSRYGTYVNGVEISYEQGMLLTDNDQVVLGSLGSAKGTPSKHACFCVFHQSR